MQTIVKFCKCTTSSTSSNEAICKIYEFVHNKSTPTFASNTSKTNTIRLFTMACHQALTPLPRSLSSASNLPIFGACCRVFRFNSAGGTSCVQKHQHAPLQPHIKATFTGFSASTAHALRHIGATSMVRKSE